MSFFTIHRHPTNKQRKNASLFNGNSKPLASQQEKPTRFSFNVIPITLYQDRNHNSTSLNNKKHKLERLSKTKQKKHLVADTFHKSVRLKVQTKNKPQSQQNREN